MFSPIKLFWISFGVQVAYWLFAALVIGPGQSFLFIATGFVASLYLLRHLARWKFAISLVPLTALIVVIIYYYSWIMNRILDYQPAVQLWDVTRLAYMAVLASVFTLGYRVVARKRLGRTGSTK